MYINMLGDAGLTRATQVAILNANYMAKQLESHYDILFTGSNGQCAHEFIIDLRGLKARAKEVGCELQEKDVAKRLMDYGFHAPTVSWPVAGTIMVEPTESEPRVELDRFCDAMKLIRGEIEDILTGAVDPNNNVVINAPHTAAMAALAENEWAERFPYSREQAVFPLPEHRLGAAKFFPTVGKIDEVYGDRNLQCTCAPPSEYADEEPAVANA